MANVIGEDAVVKRLAPMCVVQFKQDGKRDQKLKELKATGTWEKTEYVKKQGWATMPGEKEADSKVADECAKLLMLISYQRTSFSVLVDGRTLKVDIASSSGSGGARRGGGPGSSGRNRW